MLRPLNPVLINWFPIIMNTDIEKIILSAEQISSRIQEIAEDINQHYQDTVREIILITLQMVLLFLLLILSGIFYYP